MSFIIRDAVDADSAGVIRLIADIFDEYDGMVLNVDHEEPELRAPASSFERFWVLERAGEVCGSIACTHEGDHVELKKLYLAKGVRGQGWGSRLIRRVHRDVVRHTLRDGARGLRASRLRALVAHAGSQRPVAHDRVPIHEDGPHKTRPSIPPATVITWPVT
ncbi:MAG: GNAT family N-acetyltransferase [Planctomycetota bacterium]|nr:GNAT family N-acetyltransferase [Planctomycetota bacterium]